MATVTARILVGTSHPNHGGICPTHSLFLYENDRPAWVAADLRHSGIEGELPVLEHYPWDVEVCRTVYRREYSVWTRRTDIEGSLEGGPGAQGVKP